MSSLTTNPALPAATSHRARIVAEAVVSAYIHEIVPRRSARARAGVRVTCPPSPGAVRRTALTARPRTRAHTPRRRAAHEFGA